MALDLHRFFKASNPSRTLDISKPEDRQYYIICDKLRKSANCQGGRQKNVK